MDEDVYVDREAESETRSEVDRDATLLKAQAKLAEWRLKGLMHNAECARCVVWASSMACSKTVECQKCADVV